MSEVQRSALIFLNVLFACAALRAQDVEAPAQPDETVQATIPYIEREFFLPYRMAMPPGLDVLEVRADVPGKHPLALLTHGTASNPADREQVTSWRLLPQALWFARRGYVALIVVRRGYGRSGGESDDRQGGCGYRGSFAAAAEAGVDDLHAAASYAAKLPEVDPTNVISIGISTGGLVQVALAANPIDGLKTSISFAGGRGGDGKGHNCNIDNLVAAFRGFGKHAKLPMLWIYAENDRWFPPEMAERFSDAFRKGGGSNEFVMTPPDGEDGHHLFSHVAKWSPIVEGYLRKQSLLPLDGQVLPPPALPKIPAPAGLPEAGIAAFRQFLTNGPFKAFATNDVGVWGYSTAQFTQQTADRLAIEHCERSAKGAPGCKIYSRGPQ